MNMTYVREIILYLRLMTYLFLAYSMYSLAADRWTSHRSNAIAHFIFATMFLVGGLVLVITKFLPILDYVTVVIGVMDFVITPLMILGLAILWRLLIKQKKEKVKKIEDRINGSNNCLAPDAKC